MSEPGFNNERSLHDLIDKLLSGSITESQHRDLQDRLRHDPSIRQAYFDYIDLDTDLRELSVAADVTDNHFDPNTLALASNEYSNKRRGMLVNKWRRSSWLLGLAASLMLLASFMWWNNSNTQVASEESADAVLVQSAGGELYRDILPAVGQPLRSNFEYALTSGLIELKFANGAEVILEAPAVLEIAAADRLIVKHGSCSVHAPPGAEGFRVDTPKAEVVDLGTRFSVDVNEFGETVVQVVEGAADVSLRSSSSNSTPIRLTGGDARRFHDRADQASEPLPFDTDSYRRALPDRVVSYGARTDQDGHVDALLEVTVQRGGVNFVYSVNDLIGVEVTHFRGGTNAHNLADAGHKMVKGQNDIHRSEPDTEPEAKGFRSPDMASRRRLLESDNLLNTGIINPGGAGTPLDTDPDANTPGLGVRFRQPVVNGPGPDVVFFELQSVINPSHGDPFHVSPLRFAPGLRSHTVATYDITMLDPAALPLVGFQLRTFEPSPQSLEELLTAPTGQHHPSLRFSALAVGIDLTDLGYPENAAVSGLFFQDAADDDEHQVDPVFIAGLPNEGASEVIP